ncbi:MAG: alpha/beta hydrolase [Myxococcota bacterium]
MPSARIGDLEFDYDVRGQGRPLLLIMGLGAQKVLWPEGFCDALAERGFEVARFDNRDVGRSSRLDHLGVPSMKEAMVRWALGRAVKAPYRLDDLASDARGLLDHLGWSTAHVAGASMGGMVAQTLAIAHPDRVASLTSIMSHPGDRLSTLPTPRAMKALLGPRPRNADEAGEAWVRMFTEIGSGAPHFRYDAEAIRALGRLHFERGASPAGFVRQLLAILAAEDRRPALRRLSVPALVVHGTADPLVRPRGGAQTALALAQGELLSIEGMGHDIPEEAWPRIVDGMVATADRAEASVESAP